MHITHSSGDAYGKEIVLEGEYVEIREAFNGVTFVSADGERLSVCMRDSGFEVHYYSAEDSEGKGFDTGFFAFKNGTVNNAPFGIPENSRGDISSESRYECWQRATHIVDGLIENTPLEGYRMGGPFAAGGFVTAAEQKIDLIREIANWLLDR